VAEIHCLQAGEDVKVNLKILPEAEAAHAEIVHGTVYVFAGGTVARYA
jgi:hypothetical protein